MDKVRKKQNSNLRFFFPSALLFLAIIILPIFMSGYYSLFFYWDGITSGTFVGIQNYIELFTEKKVLASALRCEMHSFLPDFRFLYSFPRSASCFNSGKGIKGERFFGRCSSFRFCYPQPSSDNCG